MSQPILVDGAAGGTRGSTGRRVAAVTGTNPRTLEEFFRENAKVFVSSTQEA
jgi:hypothetical protein